MEGSTQFVSEVLMMMIDVSAAGIFGDRIPNSV